jgi:formate dehydrogenase iron-sulfur subunit
VSTAILNDITRCVNCKSCSIACSEANGNPREPGDKLSAFHFTIVEQVGGYNVKRQCMHCVDPACASVCPVGALHKSPEGPVVYDEEKCIGCRYCMLGCPFDVPKYEWHSTRPFVKKCEMCRDTRLAQGKQPACTAACPTGATVFGERDELIREAYRRIEENPDRYYHKVFGITEVGGTSVLYLSPVPFEALGFRTQVKQESYPQMTWQVLSKIPMIAGTVGVGLLGAFWAIRRREEVAEFEKQHGQDEGGHH